MPATLFLLHVSLSLSLESLPLPYHFPPSLCRPTSRMRLLPLPAARHHFSAISLSLPRHATAPARCPPSPSREIISLADYLAARCHPCQQPATLPPSSPSPFTSPHRHQCTSIPLPPLISYKYSPYSLGNHSPNTTVPIPSPAPPFLVNTTLHRHLSPP